MKFNARVINISNRENALEQLDKLGCDKAGLLIMADKAVFTAIKLEKVPAKAANLLKQTFLAKGGEVAVARGTADLSCEYTDVIICATLKQYKLALAQLKCQPWGLPLLAEEVETVLNIKDSKVKRLYEWSKKRLNITPYHTVVMGILNVTPDSFSDGGKFNSIDKALKHAEQMVNDGADIIDIGAESTRPYGAVKITSNEEIERLCPILERLVKECPVPISVDTYKADVANEALKIGANILNDVWGLQYDDKMAGVAAAYDVPVIVMHNQAGTEYSRDIMAEICSYLQKSADIGIAAGIKPENIIIDPGIGFGKTPAHNLVVMSRLEELKSLGYPILLGTSRKRFIGEVLQLPVEERVEGTAATIALGIVKGVNIVRVHDVKPMVRIARMMDAMLKGDKQ